MIIEFYPSVKVKHKATTNYPTAHEVAQSIAKNITISEFQRRDAIIRAAYLACPYSKFDLVWPHNIEQFEKYGQCRIVGVCEKYADINDNTWPKNDFPYIVLARPFKGGEDSITATVGFFKLTAPTE